MQTQTTLRQHFDANTVQVSTLLSIKTGNCPEDCVYCSQSGHHNTDLQPEKRLKSKKPLPKPKKPKRLVQAVFV